MMFRSLSRRALIGVLTVVAAAALLVATQEPAAAADTKVFQGGGIFAKNMAIRGYDPVAYHSEKRPVKGKKQFQHQWKGASWRFANVKNRDQFAARPDKFAPAYGGYCAWAVSQGYTAPTDPEAWKIINGRLYLNYSKGVQSTWEQDVPGNIAKGNVNWPGIERKLN